MLDLDILLNYNAGISRIPAVKMSALTNAQAEPAAFYTKQLDVAPGEAGYFITDEFVFCGKLVQKDSGTVVLVGPATEHPLSKDASTRIAKEMGLHTREANALHQRLSTLPLVSLTDYLQVLSFLNYVINENNALLPRHSTNHPAQQITPAPIQEAIFHNTAQYENYMLQCVEHGQIDLITPLLEEASVAGMKMGNVSNNSLRALKNITITAVTLACRAAVRGGLDYDRAMSLSDAYIQQSDNIRTFDDHWQLWTNMMIDLTARVADLRLHSNCSDLVRSVSRRINGKLYQKITVDQLSKELGVSSSYLSHQFKRETGQTLTDYIAWQKIDEAKRLMQITDLSLAQIAYQLAFSSQSYFHATFKKVTGISPGKFPRKH